MTFPEAEELAAFLNGSAECGPYYAEALPMGSRTAWVILTDRRTGGNPAPIVDPEEYIEEHAHDACDGAGGKCHRLVAEWLGARRNAETEAIHA
jgi:hypothetical protein